MLTIGTTMSRLNHLEYPAFEKMNQNGKAIKTTIITHHMISPKGPIFIGMLPIISCMEILLRIVSFSHLTVIVRIVGSAYSPLKTRNP